MLTWMEPGSPVRHVNLAEIKRRSQSPGKSTLSLVAMQRTVSLGNTRGSWRPSLLPPYPSSLLLCQLGTTRGRCWRQGRCGAQGPCALSASRVPPCSALLSLTVSTSALSQRLIPGWLEPALPARTESWPEVSGIDRSPETLISGQEI